MVEAWIDSIIPENSDFTLDNLPWGVFKDDSTLGSICVAVGNHIVDVHAWALSWTDELGFGEEFALKVKNALLQVRMPQNCALYCMRWPQGVNAGTKLASATHLRCMLAENPECVSGPGQRALDNSAQGTEGSAAGVQPTHARGSSCCWDTSAPHPHRAPRE